MLKVKELQPDKFLCARDLFCAAADAADEAQAIEQALERARTREQVHAQSYGIHSSCGIRDVMQPTDARMQLEERKQELYDQDMQLIRYCYECCTVAISRTVCLSLWTLELCSRWSTSICAGLNGKR